jgi:hypothetical protein
LPDLLFHQSFLQLWIRVAPLLGRFLQELLHLEGLFVAWQAGGKPLFQLLPYAVSVAISVGRILPREPLNAVAHELIYERTLRRLPLTDG